MKYSTSYILEKQHFVFFSFLSAWHSIWEVLVPRPGIEPLPLQWKFGVPVPGPPAVEAMCGQVPLFFPGRLPAPEPAHAVKLKIIV